MSMRGNEKRNWEKNRRSREEEMLRSQPFIRMMAAGLSVALVLDVEEVKTYVVFQQETMFR